MTSKAKRHGKRVKSYEDNPDRRVRCPEWTLYPKFISSLKDCALKHSMSRSQYFETVVQNFFLLESPVFQISSKHNYSTVEKTTRLRRLLIHPTILSLIKTSAAKSNASESKYLTLLFAHYNARYGDEIILSKILSV